jgi:hypothetical protein|tara:strand:- start:449 stop:757 length:309 start_codon:yes stop_codon:yes gene_type:complete
MGLQPPACGFVHPKRLAEHVIAAHQLKKRLHGEHDPRRIFDQQGSLVPFASAWPVFATQGRMVATPAGRQADRLPAYTKSTGTTGCYRFATRPIWLNHGGWE